MEKISMKKDVFVKVLSYIKREAYVLKGKGK